MESCGDLADTLDDILTNSNDSVVETANRFVRVHYHGFHIPDRRYLDPKAPNLIDNDKLKIYALGVENLASFSSSTQKTENGIAPAIDLTNSEYINSWPFLEQRLFKIKVESFEDDGFNGPTGSDIQIDSKEQSPEASNLDSSRSNVTADLINSQANNKEDIVGRENFRGEKIKHSGHENSGKAFSNKLKPQKTLFTRSILDPLSDPESEMEGKPRGIYFEDQNIPMWVSKHTSTFGTKEYTVTVDKNCQITLTVFDKILGEMIIVDSEKFEYPPVFCLIFPFFHKSLSSSTTDQSPKSNASSGRIGLVVSFLGSPSMVYHDITYFGLDTDPLSIPVANGSLPNKTMKNKRLLHASPEHTDLLHPIVSPAPSADFSYVVRGGAYILPHSNADGLITTVSASDLDYDGICEIIVGTNTGSLLIYKLVADSMNREGYALVFKKRFKSPVYYSCSIDINMDGLNELLVVTLLGIHFFQPNMSIARKRLLTKMGEKANRSQTGS
ncbi:Kaptin [Smittium mucronatum]|uniref:Kaptin n=1 Tax=Smittium mucronatum TaxID=133383 RepID=A0A1R0H6R3_9FUNG|nr:Kaptin [Smittium mucronatum]